MGSVTREPSIFRIATAGLLAWLLPGLGHIWLGERKRGLILMIVIALTFWSGVAIGGVQSSILPRQPEPGAVNQSAVAPRGRRAWFMAQICTGSHALVALIWSEARFKQHPQERAGFVEEDVAVIFTGVAGLLNILIILDALATCDPQYVRPGVRPPPRAGGEVYDG